MKATFYIGILLIITTSLSSQLINKDRKKIRVNHDCVITNKTGLVMFDELPVSEAELKNYLLKNYKGPVPKTTIEIQLILNQSTPPCCRRSIISDSLLLSTSELTALQNCIISYERFKEVRFTKGEETKELSLLIFSDKTGKADAVFLAGFGLPKDTLR